MFVPTKDHIGYVLPYEFHKGVDANVAKRFIQSIYGDSAANKSICGR